MTPRLRNLVQAAARAMDDGRSPFDHAFLVEHDVGLDEVYDLAETLASAARAWLRTNSAARAAHVVADAIEATPGATAAVIVPATPVTTAMADDLTPRAVTNLGDVR